MTDTALQLIASRIAATHGPRLWFADEHVADATLPAAQPDCTVITNRYDVHQLLSTRGWAACLSDFDCAQIADASQEAVFCRIAKEKALTHHLINEASRMLRPGGTLYLAGHKQEGIKTYGKKAGTLLDGTAIEEKHSGTRLFTITRGPHTGSALDDQHYLQLRTIGELHGQPLVSKPGIFCHDRIDQGSAFLVQHFAALAAYRDRAISLLDLGCGWGYLLLEAGAHFTTRRMVATDNNVTALLAARANLAAHHLTADTIAGDIGNTVHERFDIILCNPPFHQGFATEDTLTDRFLDAARRLLDGNGMALFVVNSFVPLERKAVGLFPHVRLVADNRQFKVVALSTRR